MDKVTVTQADRDLLHAMNLPASADDLLAVAAHRIEATRQAEEQIKLLRGLVEEAFLEGYALGGRPRDANRSWEQSDSRQALEATNG